MKVLAMDIGGSDIKSALVNQDNSISDFSVSPSNAKEGGGTLLRTALGVAREYSGYDRIGISVTGQVNHAKGSIVFANENVPGFTGAEIKSLFERELKTCTAVENDANAAALGEAAFGAGRGFDTLVCITFGTGIGGAVIINNEIFRGANGGAGEIGHMIIHGGGRKCVCGGFGCYEQYASVQALVKAAAAVDKGLDNGKKVFKAHHQGDKRIVNLVENWYSEIVYGLTTLIHTLQPPCLILGGGVMEQEELIAEITNRTMSCIMPTYKDVQIKKAQLGNSAGLYGAAYLARTT